MTRPAEDQKHTSAGECVGSTPWAERFPKWPPSYVAFALAHGATDDILSFREAQPDRTAYTTWIKEQELTWRASCGYDANRPMTARRLGEFERWLEQRAHANPPEPIAPIVDRVMADIMARQRGGAGVRT
jgi:hypothetical protein